ncbi:hypothetical protein [Hymenobacter cavernae]|uniref:Uncharacterized protein n=1 Tax=Hymenobacter cavernae TaxID=2044852 RepID=A0ABQ1UM65_9BACT|nr:hypothetical protein [Hymenobacter cavernae]GGF21467.1 hypothetical protein GCM10011383_36410 [Hymenobacter cavernae]
MESFTKRVLVFNLLILIGTAAFLRLIMRGSEASLGFVISMAFAILLLVFLNLIGAAFSKGHSKDFMLGALLVLLIGFGTCFGVSATYR